MKIMQAMITAGYTDFQDGKTVFFLLLSRSWQKCKIFGASLVILPYKNFYIFIQYLLFVLIAENHLKKGAINLAYNASVCETQTPSYGIWS